MQTQQPRIQTTDQSADVLKNERLKLLDAAWLLSCVTRPLAVALRLSRLVAPATSSLDA